MKRTIVLLVSLAAGLAAAVLTYVYLAAKDAEVAERKRYFEGKYGTMQALVFARDVPAGTVLTRADFGILKLPKAGIEGQALREENVSDAVGRKCIGSHKTRDVVFWTDIEGGNPSDKGLSADIKKSMRAISVNCSGAASVSGMVRPNDHVDVIGTFDFGEDRTSGAKKYVTCTILQNVMVLATGERTAKSREPLTALGRGYSTVTLEVTPREAEMLAFTEQMRGRIVLTLRNRNDTSFEKELPQVDFDKIRQEIEVLNLDRQQKKLVIPR